MYTVPARLPEPGYTRVAGSCVTVVYPGLGYTVVRWFGGASPEVPYLLFVRLGPGNRRFWGSKRPHPTAKPTGKGGGLRPQRFPGFAPRGPIPHMFKTWPRKLKILGF